MTRYKIASALLISLSVAACGSSTATPTTTTTEVEPPPPPPPPPPRAVSRIFDTDSPFQGELSTVIGVSPTAAQTILEFERRNLLSVETNPTGGAVYFGQTAMELGDPASSGRLLEGEVVLFVNFQSNSLSGQLQNLTLHDMQGGTESAGGMRIVATTIDDGRYATSLATTPFTVGGGTPNARTGTANATVDGAFVEGGAGTLGLIQGTMTIGSDPAEGLLGIYSADSN
jgi:hypothetical protein